MIQLVPRASASRAINPFGGDEFAQRLDGPCRLGAAAAVILTVQADGLLRRREAMARARHQSEYDFSFFAVEL